MSREKGRFLSYSHFMYMWMPSLFFIAEQNLTCGSFLRVNPWKRQLLKIVLTSPMFSLKACWGPPNTDGPHLEKCCPGWTFDGWKAYFSEKFTLTFLQGGLLEEALCHFVSPWTVGGEWFCHLALLSTCMSPWWHSELFPMALAGWPTELTWGLCHLITAFQVILMSAPNKEPLTCCS